MKIQLFECKFYPMITLQSEKSLRFMVPVNAPDIIDQNLPGRNLLICRNGLIDLETQIKYPVDQMFELDSLPQSIKGFIQSEFIDRGEQEVEVS